MFRHGSGPDEVPVGAERAPIGCSRAAVLAETASIAHTYVGDVDLDVCMSLHW